MIAEAPTAAGGGVALKAIGRFGSFICWLSKKGLGKLAKLLPVSNQSPVYSNEDDGIIRTLNDLGRLLTQDRLSPVISLPLVTLKLRLLISVIIEAGISMA